MLQKIWNNSLIAFLFLLAYPSIIYAQIEVENANSPYSSIGIGNVKHHKTNAREKKAQHIDQVLEEAQHDIFNRYSQ